MNSNHINNGPIERLVTELHKLPGIGPKTAQRLAYYLVRVPKDDAIKLAESINAVKEKIDAKIIKKIAKDNSYELSVKDLEIQEEKAALKEYGSSSSGASIGDILGAALEDKKKTTKNKDGK